MQNKVGFYLIVQVNLDMTDPVGPAKLVRHMQNLSYMHMTDSGRHMQVCMLLHWGNANYQTVRNECCLDERNSAHVLVSAGISQLLGTCLSGIHNANYIVNSIVCVVILVCGSRVPAYRIRHMHGPIHVLDMHGTGQGLTLGSF